MILSGIQVKISEIMTVTQSPSFDKAIGNLLELTISPVTFGLEKMDSGINWLQSISLVDDKYKNEVPTLFDMAQNALNIFRNYHLRIVKSTSEWSENAKYLVAKPISWCFAPIAFSHIGKVIRDTICEKVIGNVIKAITFVAMQILHLFPYAVLSSGATEIYLLYQVAPKAFISVMQLTFEGLLVYFIYRIAKEIEVSNKILNDNLTLSTLRTKFSMMINKVGNTIKRPINWANRTIKTTAVTHKRKFVVISSLTAGYAYYTVHGMVRDYLFS